MQVTILIPSRNGVEFLEWSVNSILKNKGTHDVQIHILNDMSDKDDTENYLTGLVLKYPNIIKKYTNNGPERIGISGGYSLLADSVDTEYIMHFHNDMYLCPNALDLIEKQLNINQRSCVCLTRIEHSMGYQPGPEKVIWNDAPLELEDWNENEFLNEFPNIINEWGNKITGGHFAPFCMRTDLYKELGGVDNVVFPLQSREDSDWAFRLVLADIQTYQVPGFVFHFASRGNRRNKYETNTLIDNPKWTEHNLKATKNFIRKWGTLNLHDEYLKPHKPVLYNIGIVLLDTILPTHTKQLLELLEIYCSDIYLKLNDWNNDIKEIYVLTEQKNTVFDLSRKIHLYDEPTSLDIKADNDIILYINGNTFNKNDMAIINNINSILHNTLQTIPEKQKSISNLHYKLGTMAVKIKPSAVDNAYKLIYKHNVITECKIISK